MVPVVYQEAYWTKYRCKGVTDTKQNICKQNFIYGKIFENCGQRGPQQLDSDTRSR